MRVGVIQFGHDGGVLQCSTTIVTDHADATIERALLSMWLPDAKAARVYVCQTLHHYIIRASHDPRR